MRKLYDDLVFINSPPRSLIYSLNLFTIDLRHHLAGSSNLNLKDFTNLYKNKHLLYTLFLEYKCSRQFLQYLRKNPHLAYDKMFFMERVGNVIYNTCYRLSNQKYGTLWRNLKKL